MGGTHRKCIRVAALATCTTAIATRTGTVVVVRQQKKYKRRAENTYKLSKIYVDADFPQRTYHPPLEQRSETWCLEFLSSHRNTQILQLSLLKRGDQDAEFSFALFSNEYSAWLGTHS